MKQMGNFYRLVLSLFEFNEKLALDFLEKEINILFEIILKSNKFEDMYGVFDMLAEIQSILATALFKNEIHMNRFLVDFVTDFDRIDDIDVREYLYNEIKNSKKS
jgi:hypothetical protein